ncbi:Protein STAY-GREEN, chloroplastic [Ananas comosus]|uniref:Protein STAY-GREEN, chloroplastic n=1 Tax=Ananas comosus TaxID=4615 RepID=A0A199VTT9_ANACO|nr:Protein STAY-GREEN, chloroplastic [Ananas comosus]
MHSPSTSSSSSYLSSASTHTSLLKMGSSPGALLLPHPHLYSSSSSSSLDLKRKDLLCLRSRRRRSSGGKLKRSIVPVARLFGPAIFESSKLKVLFLGVDGEKHPEKLPRAYTLTHSDITSKLTLAISHTINRAQGWYNKLQRDEVVAEWKKVQGKMSLHVHCHISGGHFLLDLIASLRYYIFRKELPVVLKAFVHGDKDLLRNHPELEEATVWVYFHSNLPEFNRVECWGPLREASSVGQRGGGGGNSDAAVDQPRPCPAECNCCFPPYSLIPWPHNLHDNCPQDAEAAAAAAAAAGQELQQQQ